MSKKKKVIILSCMVALLAVAAVFNYVFTAERVSDGNAQTVYAGLTYGKGTLNESTSATSNRGYTV